MLENTYLEVQSSPTDEYLRQFGLFSEDTDTSHIRNPSSTNNQCPEGYTNCIKINRTSRKQRKTLYGFREQTRKGIDASYNYKGYSTYSTKDLALT